MPPAPALPREQALAELTRRYFTSHGPAQVADFVWWSGLTAADTRVGLEMCARVLASDTIRGKAYWFASSLSTGATFPRSAWLLPLYDEYLIAYKDRSAAFDAAAWQRILSRDRFGAAVVLDGRVHGGRR